jgi:hypothetical protein
MCAGADPAFVAQNLQFTALQSKKRRQKNRYWLLLRPTPPLLLSALLLTRYAMGVMGVQAPSKHSHTQSAEAAAIADAAKRKLLAEIRGVSEEALAGGKSATGEAAFRAREEAFLAQNARKIAAANRKLDAASATKMTSEERRLAERQAAKGSGAVLLQMV